MFKQVQAFISFIMLHYPEYIWAQAWYEPMDKHITLPNLHMAK